MTKWTIFLAAYNYQLIHRPGKDIGSADALSQCPLPDLIEDPAPIAPILLIEDSIDIPMTATDIAALDPVVSGLPPCLYTSGIMCGPRGWSYYTQEEGQRGRYWACAKLIPRWSPSGEVPVVGAPRPRPRPVGGRLDPPPVGPKVPPEGGHHCWMAGSPAKKGRRAVISLDGPSSFDCESRLESCSLPASVSSMAVAFVASFSAIFLVYIWNHVWTSWLELLYPGGGAKRPPWKNEGGRAGSQHFNLHLL
ncbi:uncharacterized protein LOC132709450 [Pantherophis guttatus]|uniref:Uncharacterized protein LOC132709450 n=1 Tax=Pantherophis guttatus TaxID=94885 RepID=A0ABM3YSE1_PANGU|nr:uncharacterized protein LOC132709450 [Pantherophis guttatus]